MLTIMNYLKTLVSVDHLVTDKQWAVFLTPVSMRGTSDHKAPGINLVTESQGLT